MPVFTLSAALNMQIQILKSKIHRAAVTGGNVEYEGSMSIDAELMDEVGLYPYERILCGNLSNGERFETYAIPGPRGSRSIILNGATAHLGKVGDRLTIMSFTSVEESLAKKWQPRVVVLNPQNAIVERRGV